MKKLLLVVLLMVGFLGTAQKMSPKFLKGTWETEFHTVEFKGENKKDFSITVTYTDTGEDVEVIGWAFEKGKLYIETIYRPTEFKAIGKIVIMDENTMVEDVASDYPGVLIYRRIQTQEK